MVGSEREGDESAKTHTIRPLTPADEPFLWEILYQAIYVPPGSAPPERDIVKRPQIAKYVRDRGQHPDDTGFIAIDSDSQQPIGAIWVRLLRGENRGYGYVDDATPELTMAVLPQYRGRGVGTSLLIHLLQAAWGRYPAISLSVAPENPALRLYKRLGFEVAARSGTSLT